MLWIFNFVAILINFVLRGRKYLNNSVVAINDIGEGDNALLCVTDKPYCCKPPYGPQYEGEFYYPNNSAVGFSSTNSLYRDRGPQVVRLNRRNNVLSLTGIHRCEIPDSTGMNQNIYINITGMRIQRPNHSAVILVPIAIAIYMHLYVDKFCFSFCMNFIFTQR